MSSLEVAMSTNDPTAVTRPRSPLRYVWMSLLALLIVAVGVVGWMVYSDISISLRAEKNLHATLATIRLVEQFVFDKGRWPHSWEEMEQHPFPSTTPSPLNVGNREIDGWPAISKHLQECVAVDFHVDPEQIVRQDPAKFDAIKPIGPCYPYQHYGFIPSLQETLRKAIGKRQMPKRRAVAKLAYDEFERDFLNANTWAAERMACRSISWMPCRSPTN